MLVPALYWLAMGVMLFVPALVTLLPPRGVVEKRFFASAPTAAGADIDAQLVATLQHIRTDRGDTGEPEIRPRR